MVQNQIVNKLMLRSKIIEENSNQILDFTREVKIMDERKNKNYRSLMENNLLK